MSDVTITFFTRQLESMERNTALSHILILFVLIVNVVKGFDSQTFTSVGIVLGNKKHLPELNREIEIYFGVRYAIPPIGNLRFKNPIPVPNDNYSTLGSEGFSPTCPQAEINVFKNFKGMAPWLSNSSIDEDCLFLNIWKPIGGSAKKPVIVWIHGGSFNYGSTSVPLYDGSYLAAWSDAVVVSIQYRLGAFGFLYTGDDFAPGNVGLKDQVLALKWVNEHIDKFGGDKEKITLVGESAGGASVGIHVLSPETSKLFKRAIMLSGAPNCPWVFLDPTEAKQKSLSIAAKLGANMSNYEDVKRHLLNWKWNDIVGQGKVDIDSLIRQVLRPTIEPMVPDNPELALKYASHLKGKEIIASWTKDEGTLFMAFDLIYLNKTKGPTDTPQLSKEDVLDRLAFTFGDEFLSEKLLELYEGSGYLRGLAHLYADIFMNCPINQFIEGARNLGATVYHFEYDYRTQNTAWPEWMGIVHAADLELLFGQPIYQRQNFNDQDREICMKFMNRIKSFVETGNPNIAGEERWDKNQMFVIGQEQKNVDNRTSICDKLKMLMSPNISGSNRLQLHWFEFLVLLVCFGTLSHN